MIPCPFLPLSGMGLFYGIVLTESKPLKHAKGPAKVRKSVPFLSISGPFKKKQKKCCQRKDFCGIIIETVDRGGIKKTEREPLGLYLFYFQQLEPLYLL